MQAADQLRSARAILSDDILLLSMEVVLGLLFMPLFMRSVRVVESIGRCIWLFASDGIG